MSESIAQPVKHVNVNFLELMDLHYDDNTVHARIRQGLPFRAWEGFLRHTQFSVHEAAELMTMSPATLAEREAEGILKPDESDRLARAARVFALAYDLFAGDLKATKRWFATRLAALGGATPLEYATTDIGVRKLERLIERREHGIPV